MSPEASPPQGNPILGLSSWGALGGPGSAEEQQPRLEARGCVKGAEDDARGGAPDDRLLLELVGGVVGPQRADGAAYHCHVHWDD